MKPALTFFAALILAAVCVGMTVRLDLEYRAVHQIRQTGDSLLAEWVQRKCIPQRTEADGR